MAPLEKDLVQDTDTKQARDLEKSAYNSPVESIKEEDAAVRRFPWLRKLATYGVELRGIVPVPLEKRTDTRVVNIFSLWFTASCCLLP